MRVELVKMKNFGYMLLCSLISIVGNLSLWQEAIFWQKCWPFGQGWQQQIVEVKTFTNWYRKITKRSLRVSKPLATMKVMEDLIVTTFISASEECMTCESEKKAVLETASGKKTIQKTSLLPAWYAMESVTRTTLSKIKIIIKSHLIAVWKSSVFTVFSFLKLNWNTYT